MIILLISFVFDLYSNVYLKDEMCFFGSDQRPNYNFSKKSARDVYLCSKSDT